MYGAPLAAAHQSGIWALLQRRSDQMGLQRTALFQFLSAELFEMEAQSRAAVSYGFVFRPALTDDNAAHAERISDVAIREALHDHADFAGHRQILPCQID